LDIPALQDDGGCTPDRGDLAPLPRKTAGATRLKGTGFGQLGVHTT